MEEFNIENFKDYENVTIAEYKAALANIEQMGYDSAKSGDFKMAWNYAKIYFELSRLLDKRIAFGNKNGYCNKGKTR